MRALKKRGFLIVCIAAIIVLAGMFILPKMMGINTYIPVPEELTDYSVRTIESIGVTYEEQMREIISEFDTYDAGVEDGGLRFSGEKLASLGELSGFDYLASGEAVRKKYDTYYNLSTGQLYLTVTYYDDNGIIEVFNKAVEPTLDEERNDVYVEHDGERVYLLETFNTDGVNECLVLTFSASVALSLALVLLGVVVISVAINPDFQGAIGGLFSDLTNKAQDIFNLVKSSFTIAQTPTVTISGTKVQTQARTKENIKVLPKGQYWLCFVDPKGQIYLSVSPISAAMATYIMNVPIAVPSIVEPNKDMIGSIYSVSETYIFMVLDVVGYSSRTPKYYPENHGTIESGYMFHYHSISEIPLRGSPGTHAPHAFFGLPA
ncbi:MAG: hypothetical protein LBT55_00530 [Clostridiaceae bacterium]|jgi:hypothetical protein|nr:hypothetical protein [Clostridiaceae bacterium]